MRWADRVGRARRVGRAGLMSCARRAGRRARARNRPENGHETAFWHAKRRFSSVSGALELPRSEKPQVADRLSKSAQATSCQNAVSWPKTSDSATRPEPNAKLRTRCARAGAWEQRCKGGSGKKEEGRARGESVTKGRGYCHIHSQPPPRFLLSPSRRVFHVKHLVSRADGEGVSPSYRMGALFRGRACYGVEAGGLSIIASPREACAPLEKGSLVLLGRECSRGMRSFALVRFR